MTTQTALRPWAIFRLRSPEPSICVARFRSRNDADGYLVILRQLSPGASFQVVFDNKEECKLLQ